MNNYFDAPLYSSVVDIRSAVAKRIEEDLKGCRIKPALEGMAHSTDYFTVHFRDVSFIVNVVRVFYGGDGCMLSQESFRLIIKNFDKFSTKGYSKRAFGEEKYYITYSDLKEILLDKNAL